MNAVLVISLLCSLFPFGVGRNNYHRNGNSPGNYTILGIGTGGEYYLNGIFKYLNAGSADSSRLNEDQFTVLLKDLHLYETIKGNASTECLSTHELLSTYNLEQNEISVQSFITVCPALIYEQLVYECKNHRNQTVGVNRSIKPTLAEKYGYGTVAVLVVTGLPMVIFFVIPKQSDKLYPYTQNLLMALAASTLISDAILHKIPQALNVHVAPPAVINSQLPAIPETFWRLVVTLSSIYAMYLFSMLMAIRQRVKEETKFIERAISHGTLNTIPKILVSSESRPRMMRRSSSYFDWTHSLQEGQEALDRPGRAYEQQNTSSNELAVIQEDSPITTETEQNREDTPPAIAENDINPGSSGDILTSSSASITADIKVNAEKYPKIKKPEVSSRKNSLMVERLFTLRKGSIYSTTSETSEPEKKNVVVNLVQTEPTSFFRGCNVVFGLYYIWLFCFLTELIPTKSYGWVIIFTDVINNIIDGFAMGAAFTNNPLSGVSTTVAILFHEIPHETGDFAALQTSGISWRGAFFWNIVQSVMAFVGLYVGLNVLSNGTAVKWMFGAIAGIFMHHALSEFLPDLLNIPDRFWTYFALQNVGLIIGFFITSVLLIWEESFFEAFH